MRQTMRTLETSIFDVFEKMFFIYLESVDPAQAEPSLKTSIEFGRQGEGMVNLYFSKHFLTTMAQNMLSLEADEVTDAEREDCAREAANMVCGNFVAMLDSEKGYDLTIPLCEHDRGVPSGDERIDYAADGVPWVMTVTLSGNILRDGPVA